MCAKDFSFVLLEVGIVFEGLEELQDRLVAEHVLGLKEEIIRVMRENPGGSSAPSLLPAETGGLSCLGP